MLVKQNGFDVMELYQCGRLHSKSWDSYCLLSEISFGAWYLTNCKYLGFFLVRNGKELFKKKLFLGNKMFCYVLTLVRGNNQRGFVFPRDTFYVCHHYSFENQQLLKSKSELPRVRWHFFLHSYIFPHGVCVDDGKRTLIYMYTTSCNVAAKWNEIPGLLRIETYWKYEVVVCWEMLNISWSSGWVVEFDYFCGLFNPKDQFPKTIGNQVNFPI